MKKEGGNEGEKVIICGGYNGMVWCSDDIDLSSDTIF